MMNTLQVPRDGLDESHVTREQCIKIVSRHLNTDEFEVISYSVGPISDKKMGYLAEHLRLRASVLYKKQLVDLKFFIKAMPRDVASHAEFVANSGAFEKEASLYATLLRDLKRVQDANQHSRNLPNRRKGSLTPPEDKIKSWGPNSYMKTDEIIVLEDLSVKGFGIIDVREPLDYDHVMIAIKTLARFHSASLIFEETQLKIGRQRLSVEDYPKCIRTVSRNAEAKTINKMFPELFVETLFVETKGHPGNDFFESSITCLLAVIDLLDGYSEKDREKIKKAFPAHLKKMMALVKPYENYRNVIDHGDLWSHNILFRYEGEKVVEARLVDFQNCRYAPPGQDVMALLHLTTTRIFRESHLEEFLLAYHETVREELKAHDLNIDSLLPWEEFRESCEYFREVATDTAVIWFQLVTMPSEYTTELMSSPEALEQNFRVDRTELVTKVFKEDKIFRDRLSEALAEMIERYLLKH